MNDKKEIRKLSVKILILLCLLIVAGVAICVLISVSEGAAPDIFEHLQAPLAETEPVWIFLGMCVVLIIALMFFAVYTARLLIFLMVSKGKKKKKRVGSKKKSKAFAMLSKLDRKMKHKKKVAYDRFSLEEFCLGFRNYAASELKLYYNIEDIRRFVAGMGVSRIILLQGMSGTGKTSLAYAFGQFVSNDSVIVPVQPMWRERSDLVGYYNEFTKRFNETTLLRKLYEANYCDELYITVLDEVNISRIEYYFAEFLSLLEIPDPKQRYVDITTVTQKGDPKKLKEGKLLLPENMWFVGTANNDDSTFAISDKVYDRAMILNLDSRCEAFEAIKTKAVRASYTNWCELIENAKKNYSLSGAYEEKIKKLDQYLREHFRVSFGNRIMKQLREYVPVMIACGGTEEGAVDDIISGKILRKLSQQAPAYLRHQLEPLNEFFDEIFGAESMEQCRDVLQQLEKSL